MMSAFFRLLLTSFARCLVAGLILILSLVFMAFVGEPGWADPKASGTVRLWVGFLGSLHPVFLHLPIGALLLLVLMEGVSIVSFGRYRTDTSLPLAFALITSLLALVFGYALYLTGNYTGELIEQHKDEALIFTGLLVLCVLFKLARYYHPERLRGMRVCYTLSLFGSIAVMTLAGHNGGLITHGDPMDKWPAAVLAQREAASEALRGDPVIFEHVVQPILQERCVYCHGADKQEASLRLDSYAALLTPAESGPSLVPGNAGNSELIQRLLLPVHDEKRMPPTDKPQATAEEIALLTWWVDQGATQNKSKSELSVSDEIELALASLVSPAERTAREAAHRQELAAERRALLVERERLKPLIDAFNANYPGALSYRSSESADLSFSATSVASTFGTVDLEALLPFADVLVSANLARSVIDDTAASYIAQLTALRELNLSQTSVGNAFIAGMTVLPDLHMLNLFGTQVGSESNTPLLKLPALRTLYIGNTNYDLTQTIALREAFSQGTGRPVEVVRVDVLPELSTLTEEGTFALSESLAQTGQGDWTYVVAPHWGKIPGHEHIGPTHGGIVVDQSDRVYISTDGPHGILVFRRDGTYLKSIAKDQGPYHGLCIHTSAGQEFIYAASKTHMAKYSLDGELMLKIEGLTQSEGNQWKKGTAVAVAPSGEIFIADGYGSSVIFKYSPEGEFIKKFGHRGDEPGQFKVSHGRAVDARNPEQPLLIVCDRENGRLQLLDMEGNFVRVAKEGLRRPCAVSIQNDLLLVAELRGRAVLLDRDYKVVSVLGENPRENELAKFKVPPDAWEAGIFTAPHGCSFGQDGSIYIQDWNNWGRVTKLMPIKNLTAADVDELAHSHNDTKHAPPQAHAHGHEH